MRNSVFFALAVALLASLLVFRVTGAMNTLPNYVSPDMDLGLAIDTMLIQSDKMPDHFAHPGLGLNLILTKSQSMAHSLGFLNSTNLDDLRKALNPLLPAMEVIQFNRALTPYLAIGTVLFLWVAVHGLGRLSELESVCALALLTSLQSLLYQAMGTRTEIFALFFWSLGVALLSFLGRVSRIRGYGLIFLAGSMFGLAFFTKIQVMFYLVAAGVLLLLRLHEMGDSFTGLARRNNLMISVLTLVVFGASLLGANSVKPEIGMGTFTSYYQMTIIGYSAIAFFFVLVLLSVRRKEQSSFLSSTVVLMSGFVGSLAVHFVFFSEFQKSLQYLFLDSKMVYMRPVFYSSDSVVGSAAIVDRIVKIGSQEFLLLGFLTLGFCYLAWAASAERILCGLYLGLAGAVGLSLLLGNRGMGKDWIWIQLLPAFCLIFVLTKLPLQEKSKLRHLPSAALGLVALYNFGLAADQAQVFRSDQQNYGYRPWYFSRRIFSHNQHLYEQILREKLGGLDWLGYRDCLVQMTRLTECREQARSVVGDSSLDRLSVCRQGLPAFVQDQEWRFQAIPTPFLGATAISGKSASSPIKLQTRTDLLLWLCVEGEKFPELTGSELPEGPPPFTLQKGTEQRAFYPIRLSETREFAAPSLGEHWFVVVVPVLAFEQPLLPPDPTW